MHISFQNKTLRELCENNKAAELHFGKKVAIKLKSRLADMSAITYLNDLVVGNLRKIENKSLYYQIDLVENFVMTFTVSHVSTPLNEDGNVDNSKVSRIKITEIKKAK